MAEPTVDTRRGGWLRRNLTALVVIALAFPLVVFVVIGLPLLDQASRANEPSSVAFGDSAEVAGWRFELTDSIEIDGTGIEDNGIPTGLTIVAALIEIEPLHGADPEMFCDAELRSSVTGIERSWPQLIDPSDFGYGLGEQNEDFCYPEGEPLGFETVFITPEGTYDVATVELSVTAGDVSVLRFELAP